MASIQEMARVLRERNPENKPMSLRWMAQQWWPDADWLHSRPNRHNGGARTGARVAGAFAGRLERAGLLRMSGEDGPRAYFWKSPPC